MNRPNAWRAATLCVLGAITLSAAASTVVRAPESKVDPEAVELLRRTTRYVGGLERFSADAQTTFEDLLDSGHRVDYELSGTVTLERPNRLRTERHGDHINQIFYYDGETLTLYNPADEVYATEPAPETIDEMFQFAYDAFGISTPVSDLVHSDAFPALMQGVNFAAVIGKEVIRGVHCDHLLFSRPGVDFQIWVADSGSPLPLKYVVTDTGTPTLLSISTLMSNWNLDPSVADTLFSFVPPEGTKKITFLRTDAAEELDR